MAEPVALPAAAAAPRIGPPLAAAGGFAAIWGFLLLTLLYPLLRLFYDAFSNDAGALTLENFREFFTDAFYLRSLVNSLLLGFGTVLTTSVVGIAVAVLLVRYEFAGRNLFSSLTLLPLISPPPVGGVGVVVLPG